MNAKERKRLRRLKADHARQLKQRDAELAYAQLQIRELRAEVRSAVAWFKTTRLYHKPRLIEARLTIDHDRLDTVLDNRIDLVERMARTLLEDFEEYRGSARRGQMR